MDFNAKTNPGRESRLQQLEEDKVWDVLIIGGGATGAGIAVDAAARGFSTVLFDTQDFSEGTSSRSTKLIHGGVRYMKNPRDWKLVREAMIERKLLLGNAPHIVHPEPFILPCYENFEREYYMAGSLPLRRHGLRRLRGRQDRIPFRGRDHPPSARRQSRRLKGRRPVLGRSVR